jgi:hypothetical protein
LSSTAWPDHRCRRTGRGSMVSRPGPNSPSSSQRRQRFFGRQLQACRSSWSIAFATFAARTNASPLAESKISRMASSLKRAPPRPPTSARPRTRFRGAGSVRRVHPDTLRPPTEISLWKTEESAMKSESGKAWPPPSDSSRPVVRPVGCPFRSLPTVRVIAGCPGSGSRLPECHRA